MCVFSVVPFQMVKITNWFSLLNASFNGGLKFFYGSILVSSLCVRIDQVQEQSGCKLRFHCNKQKNDYLHSLDFSNCNTVSF